MSSSSYESTNTEYTQSGGAHVGTSFSVNAGLTDLSAAPRNGNKTGPILAEVCKMIPTPVANGYTPSTPTCRADTLASAPGTAREPAMA